MTTDFLFADHGSITVLTPVTEDAQRWVDCYLPEDVQHFGKGVVIEPRYVAPILEGIVTAGLEVVQ